jgi:Xaa-Pro dipeptidase
MESRLDRLYQSFQSKQMDSALITSKENIFYFSGILKDPHERLVALYVDRNDPLLILPDMEKESARGAGWKGEMLTYDDQTNPWDVLHTFLKENNRLPKSIGVEKSHLTLERYEILRGILPDVKIDNLDEVLLELRVIKDKKEFSLMKQAAVLADLGVQYGIEAIAAGKTEMEIVAHLEYKLKQEGVREMSFGTTVLSGKKSALPHGVPGNDPIKEGDFVLFDLGVVFEGYCSDITRTVVYKSVSDEQREIYETVLRAQEAAIRASIVGNMAKQVDQAAREVISAKGYGEYFTHRVGHGLGIDIHEFPSVHGKNEILLQEGMCYTIEPGIYIPSIGGVRIEDDIFITKNGPEVLTAYPKELQIID